MDMDAKIAICRTLSCGLEDCVRIPSDNNLQGLMGKDGKRNLVRLLLLLIHVLFFFLFFFRIFEHFFVVQLHVSSV